MPFPLRKIRALPALPAIYLMLFPPMAAQAAGDFAASPDIVPAEVEIIRQGSASDNSRRTERLRMTGQDTDRDGISDMADQCPSVAGPVQSGGCPARQDSDRDGIADGFDKCASTPEGVIVESNGCPPPPPDTDSDGVVDPEDKCPGTPAGIRVDPSGCPFAPLKLDKDKDGVADSTDKCPDTPYGKKVDITGCSQPPAKPGNGGYAGGKGGTGGARQGGGGGGYGPAPNVTQTVNLNFGPTADSDKDGVPDMLDNCPDTRPGQKVNEKGCLAATVQETDKDQDGFPDTADLCPDSPAGARVDATGCNARLEQDVSITLRVLFAVDKSIIVQDAFDDIRKVADFMQEYPDIRITLEGHTDSDASEKHNLRLSQRRAEAVRNALVARGIAADRIATIGYGEGRPIADNGTSEGKALNRRVVALAKGSERIKALRQSGSPDMPLKRD